MLPLRLFDGGPYINIDPRFLDITDVPFVLFAIVCLFVVYYKVKKDKKIARIDDKSLKITDDFYPKSYDILMQPKHDYEDLVPLTGKFNSKLLKEIFFWIVICIFYYLIFTEKI